MTTTTGTTLRVQRVIPASREEVFRAWTDPETMRRWFRPTPDYEMSIAEVDLRVGGRYRVGFTHHEKSVTHITGGVYREIVPGRRLVFTWAWEKGTGSMEGETLVTIELEDEGKSTLLTLRHERFPTEAARDDHMKGWGGCLSQLEQLFIVRD